MPGEQSESGDKAPVLHPVSLRRTRAIHPSASTSSLPAVVRHGRGGLSARGRPPRRGIGTGNIRSILPSNTTTLASTSTSPFLGVSGAGGDHGDIAARIGRSVSDGLRASIVKEQHQHQYQHQHSSDSSSMERISGHERNTTDDSVGTGRNGLGTESKS